MNDETRFVLNAEMIRLSKEINKHESEIKDMELAIEAAKSNLEFYLYREKQLKEDLVRNA